MKRERKKISFLTQKPCDLLSINIFFYDKKIFTHQTLECDKYWRKTHLDWFCMLAEQRERQRERGQRNRFSVCLNEMEALTNLLFNKLRNVVRLPNDIQMVSLEICDTISYGFQLLSFYHILESNFNQFPLLIYQNLIREYWIC